MAGKSLEDIIRQQAAQRQAQLQAQQAQERALYEQREKARQEYLQRTRMYEKLSNINPSAASAVAGGGSNRGGGSGPITNGHTEFVLFTTSDVDNYQYIILDFLAEKISSVKDAGVSKSEDINDTYIIENTGYACVFDTKIILINDNASIVSTIDSTDLYTSFNRRTNFYAIMNDGTLYDFDGKVVNTYSITMGSDYTSIRPTKNSLVITAFDADSNLTSTVYLWNPTIGLVNIYSGSSKNGTSRFNDLPNNINDSSSIIAFSEFNDITDGWKKIYIYEDDGTAKATLDITTFANDLNQGFVTILPNNNVEFFNNKITGSTYYFNIYDYNSNTWKTATHTKTNYTNTSNYLYQNVYDGTQYTSLSNGIVRIIGSSSNDTIYNIDKYNYLDIVWSIDGSTHSTFVVNNSGVANKGIDLNDADRDGYSNTTLYAGKSFFFPMWLNDATFRLLCLTATQSVNIAVGSTANLNGSQGDGVNIPGWNSGQQYVSFRIGDNFGVWLAYASNDVYKIYNEYGTNVLSLTCSTNTTLSYSGDVGVIIDNLSGIEYVITSNSLGASPSYATYSTGPYNYNGVKPSYSEGTKTPSKLINLKESGASRIYTTTGVYDFTLPNATYDRFWVSDQYHAYLAKDTNYIIYFYDWTGQLSATVDTGIASTAAYNTSDLVGDRLYFMVNVNSTNTYYYFSPTKSDSIAIDNITSVDNLSFDTWAWWNQ